jgi:hypothetical protein
VLTLFRFAPGFVGRCAVGEPQAVAVPKKVIAIK